MNQLNLFDPPGPNQLNIPENASREFKNNIKLFKGCQVQFNGMTGTVYDYSDLHNVKVSTRDGKEHVFCVIDNCNEEVFRHFLINRENNNLMEVSKC
jgi:hypothetical protein